MNHQIPTKQVNTLEVTINTGEATRTA